MPDYSFLPTALFKLVHNYISDKSFYKARKCDFLLFLHFPLDSSSNVHAQLSPR